MNWYTIFYLFSVADSLGGWLAFFAVISGILWFIVTICFLMHRFDQECRDQWGENPMLLRKSFIWLSFIFPFFVIMSASIPDRKDFLLIIAGGAVGEFVTSDTNAQALPADITRFLRKEILDATLEEGDAALKELMGVDSELEKLKEKSKEELIEMLQQQNSQ